MWRKACTAELLVRAAEEAEEEREELAERDAAAVVEEDERTHQRSTQVWVQERVVLVQEFDEPDVKRGMSRL